MRPAAQLDGCDAGRPAASERIGHEIARLGEVLDQPPHAAEGLETKEGRTAYQAINRWLGGREGESGDYFPRTLKLEYRELLFKYIRIKHRTEYIKPLPPGETWITSDEMATWLEDFYNSGQPGEPVQEWTKDVKRVFDETFGIEADALAEKVKKAPKKQR